MGAAIIIVGIIAMVVIHEGAHFLAAKAFDMKATEAFFGFGPTLWSVKRGETEYGVKAIPLGGYVRIVGMNPLEEIDHADEERTYRHKPFWQKSVVVLAGVFSHLVVALILIIVGVFTFATMPDLEVRVVSDILVVPVEVDEALPLVFEADDTVTAIDGVALADADPFTDKEAGAVTEVTVDRGGTPVVIETTDRVSVTPAYLVGVQPGDRVVSVDGIVAADWGGFVTALHERPGAETTIVVERDGREVTFVTPLAINELRGESVGFFGVSPVVVDLDVGVFEGLWLSVRVTGTALRDTAYGLWTLVSDFGSFFSAAVEGDASSLGNARPTSVVGLVRIAGPAEQAIGILAFVNLFVGMLNVVPLYPLDGGHFAVALYEKIRGRPADVSRLVPVAAVVLIFLVSLGLVGLYLDIVDPFVIPGE